MTAHSERILEAAREANAAGVCIIPPAEDGTKRPMPNAKGQWEKYKTERPNNGELRRWYPGRGGLGVVIGEVSGRVECWDFDDRHVYDLFVSRADEVGLGDVVERIEAGYVDDTPGGGVRWLVRYPDTMRREPAGIKLARRPKKDTEKSHERDNVETLIELPAYAITAPSNGTVHQTGRPYIRRSGGFGTIADYTADERDALIELAKSFDGMPRSEAYEQTEARSGTGVRPGDDYAAKTSWSDILKPGGWTELFSKNGTTYWRRPGKKLGISATTNHKGSDLLYVFTSSTEFNSESSYSKFAAYAAMEHGSDFKKATKALVALGFGEKRDAQKKTNAQTDKKTQAHFKPTEDSIALEFANRYAEEMRFCHDWGKWLRWDGNRWQQQRTQLAFHYARELAREANPSGMSGPAQASTARGAERFAQADPRLATVNEDWDSDIWLLGTPGGTVDLRTGELRPAKRGDYITKSTAVTPAPPGTPAPIWDAFLKVATKDDADLTGYLDRLSGYSLTGDISEHALAFFYGDGGNGKGVFLNTLTAIWGDYAVVASMETFTASKNDRHPTDIAFLRGARLVTAQETEEGRAWNDVRIKALTGGDPITARFMRQDPFTFYPTFKLLIAGNHKPAIRTVDDAMRRRFNILPFVNKPASTDPGLPEKLKAEWPAILRRCIDGCLAWQKSRLSPPEIVRDTTNEYFAEQDIFARWLEECCDVGPNERDTHANLFRSWKKWAEINGEDVGTGKGFTARLLKGCRTCARGKVRAARGFTGLSLKPVDTSDQWQSQHD
jgi:P4 family phage/plasmid primase-like protien